MNAESLYLALSLSLQMSWIYFLRLIIGETRHLLPNIICRYVLQLYTFQVFLLEKRQNIYCHFLKEIMFRYGDGFKATDQGIYFQKRRKVSSELII